MIDEFTALAAYAGEPTTFDVFSVVLAERPDGSGRSLEIHLANSFGEQDITSGQDTYSITVDGGAVTHYGGIKSCRIERGILKIDLDAAAAKVLGASGFEIELRVPTADIEKVKAGLRKILGSANGKQQ